MGPAANHPGRIKIGQLLVAVGSTPTPDPTPVPATPYDWRDPHYFSGDQQKCLAQVLGQVAARMGEIFTRTRGRACEVSLQALTQHFAGDLCGPLELDQDYCLAFTSDQGQPCGFVSISPPTTLAWVTWLLGDSDSTRAPNQALSNLEESLLSDLLTAVLEAFLAPLRAHHHFQTTGSFGKGQPSLQFELTEELARIVFQIKSVDSGEATETAFVLPCSRLAALAGKTTPAAPKVSTQELSRALMEHLQEVPVTVRATLAATTLTFQEILDLGPGDILLLDKPVNGSVELVLEGRTIFRGRPARSQGRYAVVIAESETRNDRPTAAAKAPKQATERM